MTLNGNLHRLVYYSRNRVAGDASALTAAIDYILASSLPNNARAQITGVLMFDAGCFGQVLEGSREALETTFERIRTDDRHKRVTLLAFGPVQARMFGHWSMRFVGTAPDRAGTGLGAATKRCFDPLRMTGDTLLALLQSLAAKNTTA